ncbi:colicin E3/pyocin S6 family cytotoxin [Pseudomonas sp. BE134]|uniref:colicin E3/pyocin S6 family cytotoxin n=1 Tax=Pseudomonas sp. BE134 TaxID=2817843 RepID=UPI00286C0B18|nr:colicin E3/pyocin S6 family cytotoxin [Pseudomonas sp. BE134]
MCSLFAFPDAVLSPSKSSVKGVGHKRKRWKDRKGRIYEWDYENGRVELYDKRGKHLGEFNPDTGERAKDAEPGRTTPK